MFRPFEMHHLYIGIVLVVVGYLLRKKSRKWSYAFIIAGSVLIADDACEHWVFDGWSPLSELFSIIWYYTGAPICTKLFGTSWPFPF